MRVAKSDALDFAGFHCHIGSQILVLESFGLAAAIVADLAAEVARDTCRRHRGDQLGRRARHPLHGRRLDAPSIAEFAGVVSAAYAAACREAGLDPRAGAHGRGRAFDRGAVGDHAVHVGTIKEIPGVRTYVAVDGGMSDNPRPATYGAVYEACLPARIAEARPFVATVAGKHCEQGDLLVRDAHLPADVAIGDVLATPATGAYGYSMASNYNLVPRPAVVFVRDGDARLVVRRETLADLLTATSRRRA